jgi:hypothetical protein
MQLVEFDSDKGKVYVNPAHVVKIVPAAGDAAASEVYLAHQDEATARLLVKVPIKKAAEEVNRCLK